MNRLQKFLHFTRRWNVFFLLLPSQVLLCVLGYAVFGQLDPRLAVENPFAFLVELPAMASYAAAAISFAVFFKMLLWNDLPPAAEDALLKQCIEGNTGARWLLIKDRIEWIVLLVIFIAFFWPPR